MLTVLAAVFAPAFSPVLSSVLSSGLAALQTPLPPVVQPEIDQAAWTTVGRQIPSIELPRIDGNGTLDLADLRGRKVLLVQFAAW